MRENLNKIIANYTGLTLPLVSRIRKLLWEGQNLLQITQDHPRIYKLLQNRTLQELKILLTPIKPIQIQDAGNEV
jgi:hypothetical protein